MDTKHKHITSKSGEILVKFNSIEKNWFTYGDVIEMFPQTNIKSIRQQVLRMVNEGLLLRVRDGIFYIIPYEQDSLNYIPDWHLLAEPLAGKHYYIGYYSALQIHNLITQPSIKEQIVVDRQIKPSIVEIKGTKFQFIYHNPKHFFGYKKTWIDSFNKVLCSDLEKTIIDCLYKPDYAGGIVEIAKAIYIAKDKLKYDQLLNYIIKFGSQSVPKRLGYILELLDINDPCIEELNRIQTDSITILDTTTPKKGPINTRWRIQQNLDIETIKSVIYT